MITPVEVLGKELKRGFGYKAIEVDEFLEELAKDYEKVYKENNELREKVSALTENLSHYRTIEESLKRALVLAEETSKETIENANNKAQTFISSIETGQRGMSIETFVSIANALNVSADALLIDSIENTERISNSFFAAAALDCNEFERRVLLELLIAAKETMRKNKRFL